MIPKEIQDGITTAQQVMLLALRALLVVEDDLPRIDKLCLRALATDPKELCLRLNLIDRCVKNIRDLGRTAAMVDGNNGLPYEGEGNNYVPMIEGMSTPPPRDPAPMESQDVLGGVMGFLQNTLGSAVSGKNLETLACTLESLNAIKNLTLPEKARLNTVKTALIDQLEKQVADHIKPKATSSEFDGIPLPPEGGVDGQGVIL